MPRIYDVLAPLGTYTTAEGHEKTRWLKCGAVIRNAENGNLSLKLDALPVQPLPKEGDQGVIWLQLKKPLPPRTAATPYGAGPDQATTPVAFPAAPAPAPAAPAAEGFDDPEIPF